MKNLRCKYKTGRSMKIIEVTATKDKPSYTYEISVVTPSGEFRELEWEVLVAQQAKNLFETNILELLTDYSFKNLAWIKTEYGAYKYALDLYTSRTWESEDWLGYIEFNNLLNKNEVIEQVSLI